MGMLVNFFFVGGVVPLNKVGEGVGREERGVALAVDAVGVDF